MGVISGIDAAVSGENTLRRWQITAFGIKGNPRYTASNTAGGYCRTVHVKDYKGWYLGFGHTPAVFPGEKFQFTGTMDQTNNYGAQTIASGAICDRIIIRGSIEKGGPIEYLVFFSAGTPGALTFGAATAADATSPNPPSGLDMKVSIYNGSTWDDETNCRDCELTISARNRWYSASGAPGLSGRTKGVIDAILKWRRYEDTPSNIQVVNANEQIRMYVTSTTYWELSDARITDNADFFADRDEEENTALEMYAALNGATDGTGVGTIKNPAGTTKWPPAA